MCICVRVEVQCTLCTQKSYSILHKLATLYIEKANTTCPLSLFDDLWRKVLVLLAEMPRDKIMKESGEQYTVVFALIVTCVFSASVTEKNAIFKKF